MYGVDAQHAFDLLRAQSQQRNTKLHVLASRIVCAASHPDVGNRTDGADVELNALLDDLLGRFSG